MRVGVVGPLGADYFADNVGDALQHIGHTVIQLGPAQAYPANRTAKRLMLLASEGLPRLDERRQRRIVSSALDAGCEVVINLDARLMPSAVNQMKRAGVRVAFWFPDPVAFIGRQLMLLTPYDALFFKEPHLVERLQANLGIPVYYLPEGCNPRWHRPLVPAGTEPYLVVAGNMYPARVRLLERLIAKDIPLRLYGPEFPRWLGETQTRAVHTGRYLARDEKARVFRAAAGVLNTMNPAEIAGVNVRLFEAAGSGAAVLTEFRSTVPQLFDVGKEILAFRDFDELINQASCLLNVVGLTAQLGDAAARRAHRDHSIDLRVAAILEKLL